MLVAACLVGLAACGQAVNGDGEQERAVAARIQKVGSVAIKEAVQASRSGEEVFKTQCVTCHGSGALGAPKFSDNAAWAARLKTGYAALLTAAIKGKNAMPPQGGGDFSELEIARAVVYMGNAAGAKFDEPKTELVAPAASASAVK